MSPSSQKTLADYAANHARSLLRAVDLEVEIRDRTRAASPALEWARSGSMQITGPVDGPPRFAPGGLASAARGAADVLGALAPRSPLISLDGPALLAERAAIVGLERQGDVSAGGSARLVPTRDGHIVLNLPRDEDWQLVPAWLMCETPADSSAHDWKVLEGLVARHAAAPLVERGRMMGLAVTAAAKRVPQDRALFEIDCASEASPRGRLRRPRLLDLTSLWAGPLATSLLAMAGVDVLKIESPIRPDGARRGHEGFFHLLNGNKRGCALDLGEHGDRGRFERLLDHADIIVESARPRALAHLGYDAKSWVTQMPGRIWASITGYGRHREWIAFGDDAATAAGLVWSPSPDDRDACFCGDAIADPLAGLHVAALVLTHLHSGRGGLLDVSMADVASHAAMVAQQDLVLPVVETASGWSVVEDDRSEKIEAPRARPADGRAPRLAAPDEKFLSAWAVNC